VLFDVIETRHKTRLQHINAPERCQAYVMKSKNHLSEESVADRFVVVEYEK
jgi:hypothetical protein